MNFLLPSGEILEVDQEDAYLLSEHSWHLLWSTRDGKRHKIKAVRTKINGKDVKLHRLIMNANCDQQVDHRDGNPLNNHRSNLRFCTNAENSRNRGIYTNNKIGFKGIYRRPSGRYWAKIGFNYKTISLGLYDSAELAHEAYKAAAIKYHGEFARFE